MTGTVGPAAPTADLELRHAVLRATDRAIGAEVAAARLDADNVSLRDKLIATRNAVSRRDASLSAAAERIRALQADLVSTRRQLTASRADRRTTEAELAALRASRSWRIGHAVTSPARRVTRWAGR